MSTNVFVKCERCHGKGLLKVFSHVLGGVCFRCRLSKDATSAPGDYMVAVSFDGSCVRVSTPVSSRIFLRMSDLAKMTRKAKIDAAAKLLAEMDSERGPHGFPVIHLVALAASADQVLRGRILNAVSLRVSERAAEAREVLALMGEFKMNEKPAHA